MLLLDRETFLRDSYEISNIEKVLPWQNICKNMRFLPFSMRLDVIYFHSISETNFKFQCRKDL